MTRWEMFYLLLVLAAFGGFFATLFTQTRRFDRRRHGRPVMRLKGDPREPFHGGRE